MNFETTQFLCIIQRATNMKMILILLSKMCLSPNKKKVLLIIDCCN